MFLMRCSGTNIGTLSAAFKLKRVLVCETKNIIFVKSFVNVKCLNLKFNVFRFKVLKTAVQFTVARCRSRRSFVVFLHLRIHHKEKEYRVQSISKCIRLDRGEALTSMSRKDSFRTRRILIRNPDFTSFHEEVFCALLQKLIIS